jgi:hypothetical protein
MPTSPEESVSHGGAQPCSIPSARTTGRRSQRCSPLAKGIYREYDSKQFVFSERHFSHVCRSFDAQMSEGEFRRAL